MTAHNPAMSFWPLERQLIDGTTPSDQDCREMLLEVRRLSAIERAASDDTTAALDRVRVAVRSRIHDMDRDQWSEITPPAHVVAQIGGK